MADYKAPLRDIQFLLYQVLGAESHYAGLNGPEGVTPELLDAVLDEAAKFAENELAPLNRSGDEQGCTLKDGIVTPPEGFKEAYAAYTAGGWPSITGDPRYDGQGLPHSVAMFVTELITSANMAWTLYPELSHGAMNALAAHGTEEQKQTYLPPMIRGEWTGTMCLTEAHAGSDVGLLRTKAEPRSDGSYGLTGTKIFISAGDHNMAENIIHLVLARLPDAPKGTKGISLFIVPKFLLGENDTWKEKNGVSVGAIEEKMGIHGNATCVLNFDDATGYLIGPENQGMRCMFTMMNAARLFVGVQGLGLMQAAYQSSRDYARERVQMRSLSGPKQPDKAADPIIVHPDVRRMLLTQKALTEGCRALAYYAGLHTDLADFSESEESARAADDMVDFLTPIVKAFLTEAGFESVNHALQIFGGHGFIRETGIEQYVRDCRITLIYEGTTQIQALDLLGRKVVMNQGATLLKFIGDMNACATSAEKSFPDHAAKLKALATEWGEMTMAIAARAQQDPEEIGAAAVDYLMYSGYAVLAHFWLKMALAAEAQIAARGKDDFLSGKIETANFYFRRLLPRTLSHKAALEAGKAPLMDIASEAF